MHTQSDMGGWEGGWGGKVGFQNPWTNPTSPQVQLRHIYIYTCKLLFGVCKLCWLPGLSFTVHDPLSAEKGGSGYGWKGILYSGTGSIGAQLQGTTCMSWWMWVARSVC